MKKRFYYSACSFKAPHIGIVIDDILSRKKDDIDIYWGYCHCALTSCFKNLDGYSSICSFCHIVYKNLIRKYGNDITVIPIDRHSFPHKERKFSFKNAEELKSIEYRGVQVGYSLLSLYYSFTRDLDLNQMTKFEQFATPLIYELCDFVDYVYELFDSIQPDEVVTYNGRLFENRLFYDIANVLNIPFTALEVVGGNGEPYRKVSYEGGLPHSIKLWTQKINDLWRDSPESENIKIEKASSFYKRRRGGDLVADVKVYIKDQIEGVLPSDFNDSLRNIAIFNSSQDELAALGGEWEANLLFKSQYEALEYLLKNSSDSIHYYLRIHPNLKGVNHKAHLDLYKLSKYKNITVIPPESEVSSYSLMDACEKVICFGSTMGVESCYWGKPSILIGHSTYENMNVCYVASSKEVLLSLIEKQLDPKDQIGALKYSYFLLDRDYRVDENIIDIDVQEKRLRWSFQFASYFKLMGSKKIFQLVYFLYCILMPKFTKGKRVFPW